MSWFIPLRARAWYRPHLFKGTTFVSFVALEQNREGKNKYCSVSLQLQEFGTGLSIFFFKSTSVRASGLLPHWVTGQGTRAAEYRYHHNVVKRYNLPLESSLLFLILQFVQKVSSSKRLSPFVKVAGCFQADFPHECSNCRREHPAIIRRLGHPQQVAFCCSRMQSGPSASD